MYKGTASSNLTQLLDAMKSVKHTSGLSVLLDPAHIKKLGSFAPVHTFYLLLTPFQFGEICMQKLIFFLYFLCVNNNNNLMSM